uniref:Uncharacterized protein LOC107419940 n=1 Tax=Rhizophora mucronata TaxID=61149 RepID=A0A2P2NMY1_RHIMU
MVSVTKITIKSISALSLLSLCSSGSSKEPDPIHVQTIPARTTYTATPFMPSRVGARVESNSRFEVAFQGQGCASGSTTPDIVAGPEQYPQRRRLVAVLRRIGCSREWDDSVERSLLL